MANPALAATAPSLILSEPAASAPDRRGAASAHAASPAVSEANLDQDLTLMPILRFSPALACLATAYALALPAAAAPADYAFEPVFAEVKFSPGAELAVRLVHKPTAKPVSGAVLFRTRLDMSPDNMGDMVAPLEAMPSADPGIYRFKAALDMAGKWALKIMAKVPGETETVQGTVVFNAKE